MQISKEQLQQIIKEEIEAVIDEKKKSGGKKDACYHKVRARYDVWPSAYASGALVKCRKVGAANWGNKSKKKEESLREEFETHDMYDPKTGKKFVAKKEQDHKSMAAKGYVHVDPKKIEKVLRDEGGASGMDPFLKEFGEEMKDDIVKALNAMPNVGQHKDKDYILDDNKEVDIVKERKKKSGVLSINEVSTVTIRRGSRKRHIVLEEKNPRIPRKKGQPAKSKKHSDLYTDEDPKGTIHGLGFKDESTAKSSVSKIKKSGRSHAHKIQAAVAMEQRAKAAGKKSAAAVYRKYINSVKKDEQLNERCQKGYKTHDTQKTKKMFGKTYRNCVKAEENLNLQEDAALDQQILSRSDYMRGLLLFIERNPGTTSDEMFNSDVANAIIPIGIRDRAITLWIKQLIKDGYITSKRYRLYSTGKASYVNHNIVTEKKKKAGTESSKESSLRDWFGRKGAKGKKKGWVDCNAPDGKGGYKSCGRSDGEKRSKYPSCRPTPGACKEKGKGKSWGKKAAKGKK